MVQRGRAGQPAVPPEALDLERALSFANTVSGRTSAAPIEKLTSFEALLDWARQSGLLKPDDAERMAARAKRRGEEAAGVLQRAVAVRELLNHTLAATSTRRTPHAATLDALSQQLGGWYCHGRLVPCQDALQWIYAGGDDLERVLWEVARVVSRLLTSSRLARVRACAADDCGWWFLDDTKNASRRWCDMKICGNREKIRRFRKRRTDKESK
jgi:predicted RNA-binding Zn ribbon-like protein